MGKQILGDSAEVKSLLNMIQRVASTKTNILVIGESGTGKELVARMIHDTGPLKDKPFIPVNCGAIPENLIESEMFGHKRGSFTGAIADKPGLFEAAQGGTLFLDEVGELPVAIQVKLLRALQDRMIRRVGSTEDMKVDVRIIAATNRDLEAAVAAGTFREDLYYRLNVILIKTPPLRARRGDIGLLARSFLSRVAKKYQKSVTEFEPQVIAQLESYDWPGNVRELENVIERAVTLETGEKIGVHSLPTQMQKTPNASGNGKGQAQGSVEGILLPSPDFTKGKLDLDKILGEVEKTYLKAALSHSGGVKKKAADLLGITFRSIRYRLTKQGLSSDSEE